MDWGKGGAGPWAKHAFDVPRAGPNTNLWQLLLLGGSFGCFQGVDFPRSLGSSIQFNVRSEIAVVRFPFYRGIGVAGAIAPDSHFHNPLTPFTLLGDR